MNPNNVENPIFVTREYLVCNKYCDVMSEGKNICLMMKCSNEREKSKIWHKI